jgi:hypothetical protein
MPEEQPAIRTAFETFIPLPLYYGQCYPAPPPSVVEDGLMGYLGAGGLQCALARVEVALPAGMGTGCDLHPHPVPREEGDGSLPEPRIMVSEI